MNIATYDPSSKVQKIKNIVGLINIKDIFEDIMQEELHDEDFHFDSNVHGNMIGGLGKNKLKEMNELTNQNDKREKLLN